jgi:hypothetical protein
MQDGPKMHRRELLHGGPGKGSMVIQQDVLWEARRKPLRIHELQENGDHYLPAVLQKDGWDGGRL